MAWKKYSSMTPEEKKESWAKLKRSHMAKKMQSHHRDSVHPSDHKPDINPGGYCNTCGHGRDHS